MNPDRQSHAPVRPERSAAAQRLFLALWPDEAVRGELRRVAQGCGGREVAVENLHVTLKFLGSLDAAARNCVEQALDGVSAAPFTLVLDRVDYRRRQRMVWLSASRLPETLAVLAEHIDQRLQGCGVPAENRPYHAHVTLMRKAARAPAELDSDPVVWPVASVVLAASRTLPDGARYQVLRRWALAAGGMRNVE